MKFKSKNQHRQLVKTEVDSVGKKKKVGSLKIPIKRISLCQAKKK